MGVSIQVRYLDQFECELTHGPSGRQLVTQAPVDNGGKGESFSPTDLLAASLGSCMLTVMGLLAKRLEIDFPPATAEVIKEMGLRPQRRVIRLTVLIQMPGGKRLDPEERAKLEEAALNCPVKLSLDQEIDVPVKFLYLD